MTPEQRSQPLWQRADDRFFWNKYAMRTLIQLTRNGKCDLSDYILPISQAFIRSIPIELNDVTFDYILISRRSCFRAGTRFHTRGIDELGHVANNVETEQIIYYEGTLLSYVQTRGSIPLFWKQGANLRYSPLKEIEENPLAEQAFRLHFDKQFDIYGDQIVVNLVDMKGSEQRLAEQFRKFVEEKMQDKAITYVHFDFHHECRRMQWQNLSKLIARIENELEVQGYFLMDKTGEIMCTQKSVVRTNCIDCLDRTNVVQSLLAKRTLVNQLQRLGILTDNDDIKNYPQLENLIRHGELNHRYICCWILFFY